LRHSVLLWCGAVVLRALDERRTSDAPEEHEPPDAPRCELSVVVPIYNEEENIDALVDELTRALEPIGKRYEVIAVDDGSSDASFAKLREAHARDDRIKVIRFRKNFGQTAAFAAGFDHARGEWVITIDADLQNDPADIPKLLDKAEEGFDIVSGWRVKRQDAFVMRKLPSKIANWLIGKVTGVAIHDYGCSLKVYHRDVVKNIRLYGELHRFVPAVASSLGIRVAELPVNHRARAAGVSKYTGLYKTIKRATKVFLDLLTVRFLLSYATRPIHVFGVLGLLCGTAGVAIGGYLAVLKLVYAAHLSERPLLLLAVLLVMVGVQLVTMGLLGELVVRTYHESQGKAIYAIREVLVATKKLPK
jgi:glycosyltransferase involved in cell wall biosynthesis